MTTRLPAPGRLTGSAPGQEGEARPARVLLVDDDGDALLVQELLDEVAAPVVLTRVRSLAEAEPLVARADCVLLDLGLPDASGLDGLQRVQERRTTSSRARSTARC